RNGFVCADRISEILNQLPSKKKQFPLELLFELKAIVQIELWEEAGLKPLLPGEVPSSSEAFKRMIHRLLTEPEAYTNRSPGTDFAKEISRVMLDLYFRHNITVLTRNFVTTTTLQNRHYQLIADCLRD